MPTPIENRMGGVLIAVTDIERAWGWHRDGVEDDAMARPWTLQLRGEAGWLVLDFERSRKPWCAHERGLSQAISA